MIFDESFALEQIQDLTIVGWTITNEEKINQNQFGYQGECAIGASELCI
jgi:hypothetical protein